MAVVPLSSVMVFRKGCEPAVPVAHRDNVSSEHDNKASLTLWKGEYITEEKFVLQRYMLYNM